MPTDHLKQLLNTLIKSKSRDVDKESLRILSQNLNFSFFEKRRFRKAVKQMESQDGDSYETKKKELIAMAEGKLEELLSRRDFLKKAGVAAAGVAAASVIPVWV